MVEELINLVEAVKVWPLILGAVALFSAAPQLVLELLLLLYPKDHPRRAEHRAELRAVPRWQRPFWVAETGIAVVFEAIPARRKALAARRKAVALVKQTDRIWPKIASVMVGISGLIASVAVAAQMFASLAVAARMLDSGKSPPFILIVILAVGTLLYIIAKARSMLSSKTGSRGQPGPARRRR